MGLPKLSIREATAEDILASGWAKDINDAQKQVGKCPYVIKLDEYLLGDGVTGVHLDIPAAGKPKLTIDMDVDLAPVAVDEIKAVIHDND